MTGKVWLHCHVNTAFTVATKFSLLKDIIISLNRQCRKATGKFKGHNPYPLAVIALCIFYQMIPDSNIEDMIESF